MTMEYVEFVSRGYTLRGMFHPCFDNKSASPAVILCHGFTGHKIEAHFLFVTIARYLQSKGIAVLRFDFAGSGESDGEFSDVTISGEVDDASAALDYLIGRNDVDSGRIGLAGLSLGGGVAALLAERRKDDVQALALLSAVASPARIISFIRTGKFETQLANWGYLDFGGLKVSRKFLQDAEHHDPAGAIAQFPKPVLIVHGDEDNTVPLSEAQTFQQARNQSSAPTQVEIIKGATHTYSTLEHTETVCRLLGEFFTTHL